MTASLRDPELGVDRVIRLGGGGYAVHWSGRPFYLRAYRRVVRRRPVLVPDREVNRW